MDRCYIASFTASEGLATGRRALLSAGLTVSAMPRPNMVSAGCDVVIKFDPADYEKVKVILRESGAPVIDYFELEHVGEQQFIELL